MILEKDETFLLNIANGKAVNESTKHEYVKHLHLLEKELRGLKADDIKKYLTIIEQKLFRIVESSNVAPGPIISESVARCFHIIYTVGDGRTFFDTLAKLQKMCGNKTLALPNKVAAMNILGLLSHAHGYKTLSLFSESVAILSKILRKETDPVLLFEAAVALDRVFIGQGRTATEPSLKDVIKSIKYILAYEKNITVRAATVRLYAAVYAHSRLSKELAQLSQVEALLVSVLKTANDEPKPVLDELQFFSGVIFKEAILAKTAAEAQPGASVASKSAPKDTQVTDNDATAGEKRGRIGADVFADALLQLWSQLVLKQSFKKRIKNVLLKSLAFAFDQLGSRWVEANVDCIAKAALALSCDPKWQLVPEVSLYGRVAARMILNDGLKAVHTETSQLSLLKYLNGSDGLKCTAFNSVDVAVVILEETACLIRSLGPLVTSMLDDLVAGIAQIRWTEPWNGGPAVTDDQVHLLTQAITHCFQSLTLCVPVALPKLFKCLMDMLDTEKSKILPVATALAGVLSLLRDPELQIYVEFSSLAAVFELGTSYVKADDGPSTSAFFGTLAQQVQAGWTLIGALLGFETNIAKLFLAPVLTQLATLFPKPTNQQGSTTAMFPSPLTNSPEWVFLLSSREAALSAVVSLLSVHGCFALDLSTRIAPVLNNSLAFLCTLPPLAPMAASFAAASAGARRNGVTFSQLLRLEAQLKSRLFQCYYLMEPVSAYDVTRSSLQSHCWDVLFPAVVTGETAVAPSTLLFGELTAFDLVDCDIWPENTASDFDRLTLYCRFAAGVYSGSEHASVLPPAETVCLDFSILLFAKLFPHESGLQQEQRLEKFHKFFTIVAGLGPKLIKLSHNTVRANVLLVILMIMRSKEHAPASPAGATGRTSDSWLSLASPAALEHIKALALDGVRSDFGPLRVLGAQILAPLAPRLAAADLQELVLGIVNSIVSQSDNALGRAGNALALGTICGGLGNLSATMLPLDTIFSVLQSLALDSHPLVHSHAICSLSVIAKECGLAVQPRAEQMCHLQTQLCNSLNHGAVNRSAACFDATATLSDALASLLNTLGPEVVLFMSDLEPLLCYYTNSTNPQTVSTSFKCMQHLIAFSFGPRSDIAGLLDWAFPFLRAKLDSCIAVVTLVYQLTQRDPVYLLQSCSGISLQLLLLLSKPDNNKPEIQDILQRLLRASVASDRPFLFFDLVLELFSRKRPLETAVNESLPLGMSVFDFASSPLYMTSVCLAKKYVAPPSAVKAETLEFAVEIMCQLLQLLKDASPNGGECHFDLYKARASGTKKWAVYSLSELVKLGFTSATSQAEVLKLRGLSLLKLLVQLFGLCMDPEFEGHALIEQYQAQFGSALSPAFTDMTRVSPVVTNLACDVCADYLTASAKTNSQSLSNLARVSKLLVGCLSANMELSESLVGTRLQISIASAWSSLYLASCSGCDVLRELVEPHLATLASLWMHLLRTYSTLLVGQSATGTADKRDLSTKGDIYWSGRRGLLFKYYERAWLPMFRALALVISNSESSVLASNWLKSTDRSEFCVLESLGFAFIAQYLGVGDSEGAHYAYKYDDAQLGHALKALAPVLVSEKLFLERLDKQLLAEAFVLFGRIFQVGLVASKQALLELLEKVIRSPEFSSIASESTGNELESARCIVASALAQYFFLHYAIFSPNPTSFSSEPSASQSAYVLEIVTYFWRALSGAKTSRLIYPKLHLFFASSLILSGLDSENSIISALHLFLSIEDDFDKELVQFFVDLVMPDYPHIVNYDTKLALAVLLISRAVDCLGPDVEMLLEVISEAFERSDKDTLAALKGFQAIITAFSASAENALKLENVQYVLNRIFSKIAVYLASQSASSADMAQAAIRGLLLMALKVPSHLTGVPSGQRLLVLTEFLVTLDVSASEASVLSQTVFRILFQLATTQPDTFKPIISQLHSDSRERLQLGFKSILQG